MNKEMLKHLASMFNTIAFAQFAVFGYTSLNIDTDVPVVKWDQITIAAIIFVNFQMFVLWILSKVKDEVKPWTNKSP